MAAEPSDQAEEPQASGEGLRVSEDAVTYYELIDGPEWEEAVRRLVYHPPLFDALRVQFGDTLPSEATLKHSLIKQGFLPRAAEEVIQVYRANQQFVQPATKRYTEGEKDSKEEAMTTQPYSPPTPSLSVPNRVEMSFSYPLSIESKAELRLVGALGVDELALLRDHIELTIRALQLKRLPAVSADWTVRQTNESQQGAVRQLAAPHDAEPAGTGEDDKAER